MIVAHHLGEHLIPTLLAAGAAAPALLIMLRAKLSRLGSALRRDRPGGYVKRVRGA